MLSVFFTAAACLYSQTNNPFPEPSASWGMLGDDMPDNMLDSRASSSASEFNILSYSVIPPPLPSMLKHYLRSSSRVSSYRIDGMTAEMFQP